MMLRCTEEVVRRIENPMDHMLGVLSCRMRQGNALFKTWKVAHHLNMNREQSSNGWMKELMKNLIEVMRQRRNW